MNKEIAIALKNPQVIQRVQAAGQDIYDPNTPDQFREFIKTDAAR